MHVDLLIEHATELVTCASNGGPKRGRAMDDVGIIHDGAVAIHKGRIVAVGPTAEVRKRVTGADRVINARGHSVIPGLVDPHTHVVWAGDRVHEFEMRLKGATYLEIFEAGGGILRTVRDTRAASLDDLVAETRERLDRMLLHGTTTIEAKSGYEMTLEGEIRQLEVIRTLNKMHPIDLVPTFCAQAIPPEWEGKVDEFAREIAEKWVPEFVKRGLVEYCDVFAEVGFFNMEQTRVILEACKRLGVKVRIHADWLAHSGGGELGVELDVVSADHLIHTPMEVIDKIAEKGIIGVFLPTTPFCYLGRYANAREIIKRGVPVALGTDLSAANMSESMQMMMTIAALQMKMTPSEVFSAATINSAHAVERAREIGSIEEGKKADIVILDIPNHKFIPYHYGVNHVKMVFKNGQIVVDGGTLVKEAVRKLYSYTY